LSQFHNSVAFITDMNALQHSSFCSDRLLANDRGSELPILRSPGVEPRYTGRREIAACLNQLGTLYRGRRVRAE
jgi:hypothetical protein